MITRCSSLILSNYFNKRISFDLFALVHYQCLHFRVFLVDTARRPPRCYLHKAREAVEQLICRIGSCHFSYHPLVGTLIFCLPTKRTLAPRKYSVRSLFKYHRYVLVSAWYRAGHDPHLFDFVLFKGYQQKHKIYEPNSSGKNDHVVFSSKSIFGLGLS